MAGWASGWGRVEGHLGHRKCLRIPSQPRPSHEAKCCPGKTGWKSMGSSTLLTTHKGRAFLPRNMRDLGVGSFSSLL